MAALDSGIRQAQQKPENGHLPNAIQQFNIIKQKHLIGAKQLHEVEIMRAGSAYGVPLAALSVVASK
jgi:hypothetical protein